MWSSVITIALLVFITAYQQSKVKGKASIAGQYIRIKYQGDDTAQINNIKESINKLGQNKVSITGTRKNSFTAKINKRDRKKAIAILKRAGQEEKIDLTVEGKVLDYLGTRNKWRISQQSGE
jgi:outer membrane lipopolysaccharide assembly protein LptE/RlpB